jgi:hypothetical protein
MYRSPRQNDGCYRGFWATLVSPNTGADKVAKIPPAPLLGVALTPTCNFFRFGHSAGAFAITLFKWDTPWLREQNRISGHALLARTKSDSLKALEMFVAAVVHASLSGCGVGNAKAPLNQI